MDADLKATLLKLALPALAIAVMLAVTRARGLRWKEDLRLLWPRPITVALWVAAWLVWIAIGEVVSRALQINTARPWKAYALAIVILRVLAIGVLGPISEELVFRGVLFAVLLRKLRLPLTLLVTSVGFGLMHYGYDWPVVALVCLDGLFFGLARYRSGSTYLTMLLHSIGNLISIAQSLSA
jgi:membrane protease YdiL (CAAX protease family)